MADAMAMQQQEETMSRTMSPRTELPGFQTIAEMQTTQRTSIGLCDAYDELRVAEKPGKPHVCVGDSTAAFELSPPEYWQMGTFAEAGRQGPYLWARLAKAPRHAVGDPTVTYMRRRNQRAKFQVSGFAGVVGLGPADTHVAKRNGLLLENL